MGASLEAVGIPMSRSRWLPLVPVVIAVLLMLLTRPVATLAMDPQSWSAKDQGGRNWSLTLLDQADSAYAAGLRLRITDRSGGHRLDHRQPLRVRDGIGGSWLLDNHSEELVPAGREELPAASAQFDLAGLKPRPRSELPLVIELSLETGGKVTLVAGAAAAAGLHGA